MYVEQTVNSNSADLKTCEDNYEDEYVKQLQNSVKKIKISRDMEARYMVFEEMMRNEFKAGKEEGRIEGRIEGEIEGHAKGEVEGKIKSLLLILETKFSVSDNLKERLMSITEDEVACALIAVAINADSLNSFIPVMENYNL